MINVWFDAERDGDETGFCVGLLDGDDVYTCDGGGTGSIVTYNASYGPVNTTHTCQKFAHMMITNIIIEYVILYFSFIITISNNTFTFVFYIIWDKIKYVWFYIYILNVSFLHASSLSFTSLSSGNVGDEFGSVTILRRKNISSLPNNYFFTI